MQNEPGTNYFAALDENVNISLTNELGFSVLADCNGDPNVVALHANIYNTGCDMIRNDVLVGNNKYVNTGTLASPVWTLSGGGGGGLWTPLGVTTATVGGIPAGTDLGTTPIDPAAPGGIFDQEFYPAQGPGITLSTNPNGGLFEAGDISGLTSILLSAVTTKRTNSITKVEFYRNNVLIDTDNSPNPNGGTSTFTDSTPITSNTTYKAIVYDGILSPVTSNQVSFTFVFAYYYGVSDPALDITSDGGGLTKLVIVDSPSLSEFFSPTLEVYDFAYPASYPVLTSILDKNGFETISDYTISIQTVTNSFGASVSYRLYYLNHITTQVLFKNTFIQ